MICHSRQDGVMSQLIRGERRLMSSLSGGGGDAAEGDQANLIQEDDVQGLRTLGRWIVFCSHVSHIFVMKFRKKYIIFQF